MESNNVVNDLYRLYSENKFAHAYLFETNNISLCVEDIKKLIKMTICHEKYTENCDKCSLCRLVDSNTLPSLIIVEPDGKTINKDSIEYIKNRFSYNSVYTDNNYYIIVEAEKMNDSAYNKMLKFLEEPEERVFGFYICSNIQKVPETILSRLEHIKMYYENESNLNEELISLAKEYLNVVLKDNENGIWYNNSVLLKKISDRVDIIELFKYMLDICINNKQFELSNIIRTYLEKLEYNVNIPLTLDSFVIEVGELDGI